MKTHLVSLKQGLRKILICSISIFLCVQILIVWALFYSNNQSNLAYIKNTVSKTASSIDNYLGMIEKSGFSISSNFTYVNLYSPKTSLFYEDSYSNAYQAASQICTLVPGLIDLVVVDLDGTKKSYFSGYDYTIVDQLAKENILQDPDNLQRSFFFFPDDTYARKDYFLYYFPILSTSTTPINTQKSATGIFICNRQTLDSYLMPEQDTSSVLSLYYNDLLLYSTSDNVTEHFPANSSKICTAEVSNTGISVIGISASPFVFQKSTLLMYMYLFIMILFFVLLLLLLNRWIHRYITVPISDLSTQLRTFNSGDLNKRISYTNVQELNDITDTANQMIDNIKNITKKIFSTQDMLYETVLRKTEAELYALQSQVNPHFLYNTLQCIRGLATLNRTDDIKNISLAMSDVFKYSIAPGTYVTYLDEIRIIHKYLSIYKIRFNGKIDYDIDVDEEILQCYTVKMIIQPTVENAVVHAFKDLVRKPCIHIIGKIDDGRILFRIIDNGNGIPSDTLKEIRKKLSFSFETSIRHKSSYGIGLYNISRRIKLAYGEDYGIEIFSNMNGTEVDIITPIQKKLPESYLE